MESRLMVQEGHLLAVFNSAHRVMKAENLLKALGLPILLIPVPRQLNTDCALALRFTEIESPEIMRILEQEQLLPAFVCKYRDGSFDMVWNNVDTISKENSSGEFIS